MHLTKLEIRVRTPTTAIVSLSTHLSTISWWKWKNTREKCSAYRNGLSFPNYEQSEEAGNLLAVRGRSAKKKKKKYIYFFRIARHCPTDPDLSFWCRGRTMPRPLQVQNPTMNKITGIFFWGYTQTSFSTIFSSTSTCSFVYRGSFICPSYIRLCILFIQLIDLVIKFKTNTLRHWFVAFKKLKVVL